MSETGSDQDGADADPLTGLTTREVECLALVHAGLESKEIAPLLGIVPGTVDLTLKRASRRTGIPGRRALARLLSERQPELIQSVIQRLGQVQKPLVGPQLASPDMAIAPTAAPASASWFWPVPTAEREWNDLPAWQKRLWAIAIALGLGATAALLVTLSRHVLVEFAR